MINLYYVYISEFNNLFYFQSILGKWEDYESGKTQVCDLLKRAENEVAKTVTISGHESVQKDLQAKQVKYSHNVQLTL